MAKQVKCAGDLDRIGNLPDPILSHILCFLPIKEAVRSSVLSLSWKYLFASMSTIDIDDRFWTLPSRYIYRLLSFSNELSLESFRLRSSIPWNFDYTRHQAWIHAAVCRGIKELVVESGAPVLPTSLFTCDTLVTLKLNLYGNIKVPTDVCLPNLKTLHLSRTDFIPDPDSFHRLISNCLALEDLDLDLSYYSPDNISKLMIHNLSLKRLVLSFQYEVDDETPRDFNYVVEINAPSLVYFKYVDLLAEGYTLSTMSLLEKADITIRTFERYDVGLDQGAIHLLQTICNVQSLCLSIDEAETLFGTSPEPVFAFHNLVELTFQNYTLNREGPWILEFLHCAPNLKKLTLGFGPENRLYYWEEELKSVPNKVASCLLFHLKEIEIVEYDGDKEMFNMIRYFLNHAIVLEKLIIGNYSSLKKWQSGTIDELLGLPRNSKKCQVV